MSYCKCGHPFCENNPVDLSEAHAEFSRLNEKYIISQGAMTPEQLEHQLEILRTLAVCILGSQVASYILNNYPEAKGPVADEKALELLTETMNAVWGAARSLMEESGNGVGAYKVPFADKAEQA